MKKLILTSLFLSSLSFAADYVVVPGKLHEKGKVEVVILPNVQKYKVRMTYDLNSKIPLPQKLLKGEKIMEFPVEFRTEDGYKKLAHVKRMDTPKAQLRFHKRGDFDALKNAYFIEVHPKNKKSRISLVYHPTLPAPGWKQVTITMLNIPMMENYEVVAKLKK